MIYLATADIHARKDVPLCRKETDEEWLALQGSILQFMVSAANKAGADMLISGDLFDTPRTHNEVVYMFLQSMAPLKGVCHIIGGNHSLLQRVESNIASSSVGILQAMPSPHIQYHTCVQSPHNTAFEHSFRLNDDITMVHTLCFPTEDDIPFAFEATTAQMLLDCYDTKYVCVGDMHKNFVYENGGRYVVNSGKAIVQKVSEMDMPPVCYLIDTDKDTVVELKLPHDPSMITDEHIKERHERDDRIASAVSVIRMGKKISLSFKDNLREAEVSSKLSMGAKEIITEIENEI